MCCICNPSCNMPEHAQPQRSNNNSAAPDESVSLFVSIQYAESDESVFSTQRAMNQ